MNTKLETTRSLKNCTEKNIKDTYHKH